MTIHLGVAKLSFLLVIPPQPVVPALSKKKLQISTTNTSHCYFDIILTANF